MPDSKLTSSHSKTGLVSLPESFFTQVMPRIQDMFELKAVLYVAYLVLREREPNTRHTGPWVTYRQLKTEVCRLSPDLAEETLRQALDSAVKHGALLRKTREGKDSITPPGALEDVYSLTTDVVRGFSLAPEGKRTTLKGRTTPAANIFSLYEQNIGIITPMIAEELKEAEKLYPPQWIEDAFKEAVALNRRSWRYVARILERWAREGKDSGEYRRDAKKDVPDKYVRGKYGHLVKR